MPPMNDVMWQLLEEAATTDALNRLADAHKHQHEPLLDAMVEMDYLDKRVDPVHSELFGYSITPNGEEALREYRAKRQVAEPSANVAPTEWSLLAEVEEGKYNQVTGRHKPPEILALALNDLVEKGYVHVDIDRDLPAYIITDAGTEALAIARSRVPGKSLK